MIRLHQKLSKDYTFTTEEERLKVLKALEEKIENAFSLYKDAKDYKIIHQKTMLGTISKVVEKATNRCIISYILIEIEGEILLTEEFIWEPI